MKDNVRKEINDLHNMVQNWKKDYLRSYDEEGGNEWLLDDFVEEITLYLMPYVTRLAQCDHIDKNEYTEFLERTRGEIIDLRRLLRLPEPEEGTA